MLVPGDPRRALTIAETFFEPDFRCVNEERGMLGYTGTFEGKPISVQSVGMGGSSAAIYYEELIQLGVKRIVRVGTAGGLDPSLKLGDTVLAVAATPDDPIIHVLLNGEEHAPTATWNLLAASVRIAEEAGVVLHPGPIVSSALFYDERPGIMERWRDRGHLAVEMEVSTLYTIAALRHVEAVALVTISDLILGTGDSVRISDEELAEGVRKMMQIACRVAVS
ncbi:MAG: purine-nucleoside phosphorylase [Rhodococcus sp. (in: high G+C Gram-positive bacteria)]